MPRESIRENFDTSQVVMQERAEQRIGIVLVHYNCFDDTVRCLESLRALEYRNYFIVVVDNGSTDGSGVALQNSRYAQEIELLLLNPENRGFAAANNVGICNARVHGAEAVWLLNPDTSVSPSSLSELVHSLHSSEHIAASGSKVLYAPEQDAASVAQHRIWSAGAEIDFEAQRLSMRGNALVDEGQFQQAVETDYLPGCSMLVPFSTIDQVGLMPEEYFMYFEETDWCTRMTRAGFKLHYEPQSVIWHHFEDAKMQQPFSVYYYNRNSRLFWFRYGTFKQRCRIVLKTLLKSLPSALRALAAAPDTESRQIFRAHVLSCTDFLRGRFQKREDFTRKLAGL